MLHDLNLELSERRIAVIGSNGSGKSTFARLLNGLLLPSEGEVLVDGLDTRKNGAAIRRKVGFVFQNPDSQIVYPTVAEDLAFGLKREKLPRREVERRIEAILARYRLTGFENRLVHELSGGERQLVALAGVMVMEPETIVMDEPTTLLDLANTKRVLQAIEAAEQRIVLVSHDLSLLAGFERALCFHEGRLYADGPPGEVIARYEALVS